MTVLLPCSRCKRELPVDQLCAASRNIGRHARRRDRREDPERFRARGRADARLLCFACNTGIGKLGDDPERLRKALAYLEAVR